VFIYIYSVFLIECAGSVGISLAGRVMYIFRVSLRCVEWRAGSILFDHCGGVGGGTVQVFLVLWLCSGGYSTVEMVRGGVIRFFLLLSSVCCQFSWRLSICGRNFVLQFFVGSFVVFFAVSYFTRC
jgi:hypothetical protein